MDAIEMAMALCGGADDAGTLESPMLFVAEQRSVRDRFDWIEVPVAIAAVMFPRRLSHPHFEEPTAAAAKPRSASGFPSCVVSAFVPVAMSPALCVIGSPSTHAAESLFWT